MSGKCAVEGWLVKKKGKDRSAFFSKDNLRYFKIQEVRGQDYAELAFCYFKSQKDKEARGWIYLKDIVEISDDEKSFTVVSAARTMIIEAQSPSEYLMWLQTLVEYCPNADTSNLRSPISISKKHSGENTPMAKDTETYQTLDALTIKQQPAATKTISKSASLFSRQAYGEDNSSFYLPAQGIHKAYSSSASDIDGLEVPMPYNFQSRDVGDTDDDNSPRLPSSSQGNGKGAAGPGPSKDREDHRKMGYRGASSSSNATNRLHQHISKENSGYPNSSISRLNSEIEEIQLEAPSHPTKTNKRMPPTTKSDSQNSMYSVAEEDEEEVDYDAAESGSNRYSSSVGNSNNNSAYNLSSGNLFDASNKSLTYSMNNSNNSLHAVSGSGDEREKPTRAEAAAAAAAAAKGHRGSFKKMNAQDMTIDVEVPEAKDIAPKKVVSPTGKRGMPTKAPPQRAIESLNQVEAAITSTGSGKARMTIDELLSRRRPSLSSNADSKAGDDRNSGSKFQDDSDEEDFDFKAEHRHYSSNINTASTESITTTSRPPRAPHNAKNSPYATPAASSTNNLPTHAINRQRSNTPPRRPQDPGAKTDSNFVTDNWDEEDEDTGRGGRGKGSGATPPGKTGRPPVAEDKRSGSAPAGRDQYGNAVKQDDNWLDEDFDD